MNIVDNMKVVTFSITESRRVYSAVENLANTKILHTKILKIVIKSLAIIEEREKSFNHSKNVILEHYSLRNKDGTIVLNGDGTANIADVSNYTKDIKELEKAQADIKIKLPVLSDIDIEKCKLNISDYVTFYNLNLLV